jgi:cell division transport system ATP-binding protein
MTAMSEQPHLPDEADETRASTPLAVTDPPVDPEASVNGGDPSRAPSSAMILFDQVTKVYEPNIMGLRDVSLQIDKGEFVFLVGPSGSGKSTFIKLLLKELDVTSGNLIVGGRSLPKLKRSKVPILRRNIGCVFQDFKLLPNRTVYQNVGGEQQRVSVARAFVNHPPLLIADEPTGNLDPDTSVGIMQLLYRINRAGTTVVMATHDREMVDKMRRRVIQLEDARVVRDDRRGGYER